MSQSRFEHEQPPPISDQVAANAPSWAPEDFTPRRDHILGLDGLRGIAVLLVLVAHFPFVDAFPQLQAVYSILKPGYQGVNIFFVLSGFLITRLLIADKCRGRPLTPFLYRRFLRIFPIYYLTIAVLAFIEPGQYLVECAIYISNYTFAVDTSHNPMRHTWSLAVEEHFYLVWPFMLYAMSFRRARLVATVAIPLLAIAASLYTYTLYSQEVTHGLVLRGTVYRSVSLALGAFMAFHEGWFRALPKRTIAMAIISAAAGSAVIAIGNVIYHDPTHITTNLGYALQAAAVVLLCIALNGFESPIRKLLESAWLRYIGRISYGIYLYHYPIFYFLDLRPVTTDTPLINGAIAVALTFIVSSLSFRVIERPLLKLKDKFR